MHAKAKQTWAVGQIVSVGFVKDLVVMEKVATPGDYRPDLYRLISQRTGFEYEFTPHYGLRRVNV